MVQAAPRDAQVVVWGVLPCFCDGRRVREHDVPQSIIVGVVRDQGLKGWWLEDGELRAIEPAHSSNHANPSGRDVGSRKNSAAAANA